MYVNVQEINIFFNLQYIYHLIRSKIYDFQFTVYQMEFNKTRWSCQSNSDQNCVHTILSQGVVGVVGSGSSGVGGSVWYEIDSLCMT